MNCNFTTLFSVVESMRTFAAQTVFVGKNTVSLIDTSPLLAFRHHASSI